MKRLSLLAALAVMVTACGAGTIQPTTASAYLYVDQCSRSLMGATSDPWWDPDDDVASEWRRMERTGIDIKSATLNSAQRVNSNTVTEWWQFLRANGNYEFTRFYCQIVNGYYTDAWVQSTQ
jgi:hypothetical protein